MSGVDAFPMIARCSLAQWRGYPEIVRYMMDAAYSGRSPGGDPGRMTEYVGEGYDFVPLWRAHIDGHPVLAVKVEG